MSHAKKHIALASLLMLLFVLASCRQEGKQFKMEGRFRHLNSGEFMVYSLEGTPAGLDTIRIQDGRIGYGRRLNSPATFVIIFPNYSEQPVFAEPGKTVKISGDASHLRQMEVKGTRDNELMNKIRERLASSSPDERKQLTEQFIGDHPESRVGIYLVTRFVIQSTEPDYKLASQLVKTMLGRQPRDGYLVRLDRQLEKLAATTTGETLPTNLKATAADSTQVDFKKIRDAEVAVIHTWASWQAESMVQQRQLTSLARRAKGRMELLGISVDAVRKDMEQAIRQDTITWPIVFDGRMMQTPLVDSLALSSIPDNIVLSKGKIVARSLPTDMLVAKIEEMLGTK